jgi:hypothetical protein
MFNIKYGRLLSNIITDPKKMNLNSHNQNFRFKRSQRCKLINLTVFKHVK